MTRPTYETGEDLAREKAVAEVVAKMIGGRAVKTAPYCLYDYTIVDAKDFDLLAIIEIKCRTQDYDTLKVSRAKVINLLTVGRSLGVPAYLVWSVGKTIRMVEAGAIDTKADHCVDFGRTDRGDPLDHGPAVQIPRRLFKEIQPRGAVGSIGQEEDL